MTKIIIEHAEECFCFDCEWKLHEETKAERILAENKTKENAEAICNMVVMRRGLDEEFYKVVSHV